MKVHILDDWFDTLRGLDCFKRLDGHEVTVWTDHVKNTDVLAQRLKDAQVLVLFRERTSIQEALLDQLPALRLISQRSVYPHIDVAACTKNGVLLCSNMHAGTPSYAAAELTLALMLAAYRQIPEQTAALKAGRWQVGVGRTLRGRTLGLYGYGRIAKAVAGYGQALGMNVVWWASEAGRERAASDGATLAPSRKAFFQDADVVSLHVRLKPDTRGVITRNDLAEMRGDSLLINTSRSGLIEAGALLDGLNAGRPGLAAVDVFDTEPVTDPADPLVAHPRLIGTPHIGYVTEDEFDLQFSDIFDQVVAFAAGAPIHMVNPEVWRRESTIRSV